MLPASQSIGRRFFAGSLEVFLGLLLLIFEISPDRLFYYSSYCNFIYCYYFINCCKLSTFLLFSSKKSLGFMAFLFFSASANFTFYFLRKSGYLFRISGSKSFYILIIVLSESSLGIIIGIVSLFLACSFALAFILASYNSTELTLQKSGTQLSGLWYSYLMLYPYISDSSCASGRSTIFFFYSSMSICYFWVFLDKVPASVIFRSLFNFISLICCWSSFSLTNTSNLSNNLDSLKKRSLK